MQGCINMGKSTDVTYQINKISKRQSSALLLLWQLRKTPWLSGNANHHSARPPTCPTIVHTLYPWVGPLEIHTWSWFVGQDSSIHPLTRTQEAWTAACSLMFCPKPPTALQPSHLVAPIPGNAPTLVWVKEKRFCQISTCSVAQERSETEAPIVNPWGEQPCSSQLTLFSTSRLSLSVLAHTQDPPQKETVLER